MLLVADLPVSPELTGWLGLGVLCPVLAWIAFRLIPDKDKQIKELIQDKNEQVQSLISRYETTIKELIERHGNELRFQNEAHTSNQRELMEMHLKAMADAESRCERARVEARHEYRETLEKVAVPLSRACDQLSRMIDRHEKG